MPNTTKLLGVTALLVLAACAKTESTPSDTTIVSTATGNVAPASDEAPGAWKNVSSLTAWRAYKGTAAAGDWHQMGDTITKMKGTEDLVSREMYENFEFEFDWKLSPGGNAGVFYHVIEEGDKPYWTGPEYQLLDDARHPDGKSPLTSSGAAYGLYPPPRGVVKAAGEWNSTRILIRGPHVEHWLNGQKVVEYELWSPDWEAKVKASKFNEWKGYGRSKKGYIGIQGDHTGELSLRNLRIRTL